jgi:two-component system C4-dicarboxylate transport response regulator DctD
MISETLPHNPARFFCKSFTTDDDVPLAAGTSVPVLITSSSGERRELCARLIHAMSARARGPFVTFSPSGTHPVVAAHLFDQARDGTLFLDDIAALSQDAQTQLLDLWGGEAVRRVRVLSGASRHLTEDRAKGSFSEPLFYRLNVLHLDLTGR